IVLEPLIYSNRYSNHDAFHTFVAQFAEVLPVVADETIYLEVEENTRLGRLAEINESIDPTYTDSWENIHEQFAAFPEITVINNDGSVEDTVQAVVSVLHQ
ncbi:hypothetical protein, partial [Halorubrum sp. SD626R]|uniref:hypothetical protein n=1 Tax=Halorubrum sp. SD626R TaxID=1419722 RepID=UPI001A7ECE53